MEKYGDQACPNCGSHNTLLTGQAVYTGGIAFNMKCGDCESTWTVQTQVTDVPPTPDFRDNTTSP